MSERDTRWSDLTIPEPNTGCLLWIGGATPAGYGITSTPDSDWALAHRIAYERAFGAFDPAWNVCHRCDTPSCVNPDHLFLGTQRDNMRDKMKKKRADRVSTATSSVSPLAPTRRRKSVKVIESLHLIRTDAVTAPWRTVTGAPAQCPDRVSVQSDCPPAETQEPSTSIDSRLLTGATAAPCCGENSSVEPTESASLDASPAPMSRLSGMAAWLTEGSPWWDSCSCGHYRWAHTDGACDRLSEPARSKKLCRCRSFYLATAAADPLLAQPARMGGGE